MEKTIEQKAADAALEMLNKAADVAASKLDKAADAAVLKLSQAAERVVQVAASAEREKQQIAANAADQLTLTAAHAAQTLSEATKVDLGYIREELKEIKKRLDDKFVTKEIFDPIRKIVYGQVVLVLIAVVGALLTLVLRK